MGSGLILLLIVGMWLAVLVPMWLKSYDSGANLSSVDRFSDAMRVLSRRHVGVGDRRTLLMPPRPQAVLSRGPGAALSPSREREARIEAALARTVSTGIAPPVVFGFDGGSPAPDAVATGGVTPAQRRLRTLRVLGGVSAFTLLLAVVGPGGLLLLHLLVDLALVAFVVSCRRQAVLQAAQRPAVQRPAVQRVSGSSSTEQLVPRQREQSLSQPVSVSVERSVSLERPAVIRVAGIPERMPSRPAAMAAFVPAQATGPAVDAAGVDLRTAAAVHGAAWSPVPVPVPMYVNMPVAPGPEVRVVDLTHPGKWSDNLLVEDDGLRSFEDDSQLDDLVGRRRAAGDW